MDIPHEFATKTEYVYRGRIINVRRDEVAFPDGTASVREIVEHRGAVAVAAVDDERNVYMVRQFRYAFGEELWEIPAGKLEEGEDDQREAAIRELREETGLTAGRVEFLGVIYPSVGYVTEKIHLYLATELRAGEQSLDPDEYLTVTKIPLDELRRMVRGGEIKDAKTICALMYI
jgi:ADP-ribose pyrophosphatase